MKSKYVSRKTKEKSRIIIMRLTQIIVSDSHVCVK